MGIGIVNLRDEDKWKSLIVENSNAYIKDQLIPISILFA